MAAWDATVEACRILRASAILFQCPASFKATEENVVAMHEFFFAAIEREEGVRLLWEPRGPWPDELVLSVCRALDLIHAVDPFIRPSLTPELLYWRLHGNGSAYARYTDADLLQLIAWLDATDASDAYVMFNNIPRVQDVKRFRELQATGIGNQGTGNP